MLFPFTHLCDLLENLEKHSTHDPPFPPKTLSQLYRTEIEQWFDVHRTHADESGLVLLTALFPERRTDRVYGIREKSLTKILGRVLHLGVSRIKELGKWTVLGYGDLGACVERVQRQAVRNLLTVAQEPMAQVL
jgi:DNA ligase 4